MHYVSMVGRQVTCQKIRFHLPGDQDSLAMGVQGDIPTSVKTLGIIHICGTQFDLEIIYITYIYIYKPYKTRCENGLGRTPCEDGFLPHHKLLGRSQES